jgi:arginyl-tRNA synthetase
MSTPAAPATSIPPSADPAGIVAREELAAAEAIRSALRELGIDPGNRPVDLRALPFEGTWGSASTVARLFAGELVNRDLEASGEIEGLSKKEAKKRVNELVGPKAQEIASRVAATIAATGRFANVEALNGYINFTYNANTMAARLLDEVFSQGDQYGHVPEGTHTERVMIEHSQLNTHKAAHVGHLRNICLGVAVTNISAAAGYPTIPVNYIGDIGRHVIRCLWCYINFHQGEEPQGDASKGRWLGEMYAEADARLSFRKDALSFLQTLVQEDLVFVSAVDRMLRFLWRTNLVDGEDIAYLLGRISGQQEIELDKLNDANVIAHFWPFIGDQLREELTTTSTAEIDDSVDLEAAVATPPSMTPAERVEAWERLNEHMAEWWPAVPGWEQAIKDMFQLWETKDPDFVALWERTRDWSMADLMAIFEEFGAHFDHIFWESGVEDAGRAIVRDLLERGIAEVSDGLPVVKIDEKLGLQQETYRTMPILRSDGTTLYSTKDLALTRQKFEEYGIDRAVWVVDVRQSLYFDQIFKILELAGFEQAEDCVHLGYEFVALPSGAISSRKGNAPMLEDVRDAMLERARSIIQDRVKTLDLSEEDRDRVAQQVAIGAIKYMMLARDGNKVIIFDPEEALSFDGHSAPYIQYAHARACRILEIGAVTDADLAAKLDALDFGGTKPEELALLQAIADFPGVLQRAAEEFRPLHITNYVYDVAKRFNDFYHACPVLISEEPTRTARLTLVAATRSTLKNGLALLGIEAPEVM